MARKQSVAKIHFRLPSAHIRKTDYGRLLSIKIDVNDSLRLDSRLGQHCALSSQLSNSSAEGDWRTNDLLQPPPVLIPIITPAQVGIAP